MGVKNLWDVLESCRKTLPLHHLQNKRVCVDLSCWIVQLQNVSKSHASAKDKLYLRSLFHRLRALIALNCSLIFVTDGSIPAIKLSTYRRRLNSGNGITRDETNSHNVSSLRRNMGSEFSCMIKEAKVLGLALGIPCLDGPFQGDKCLIENCIEEKDEDDKLMIKIEEAEAQCALLNSESFCDGCFTSDSDVFLFGAKTVYRDICLGEGGYVVCYEMADIESKLGFGRNSLITLGLLLGSDYYDGVHGFGRESACQIVKSVGEEAILKKISLEGVSFAKKSKGSRKQGQVYKCNNKENCSDIESNSNGSKHSSQKEFLQVIDAYLKPKCHSADSDAVHRALALLPFQRTEAQRICAQLFEWPPEKTDEYLLPKIAERDLRRFANLRSTSSNLGIHIPLQEVPVKCPISGIIKHRKVQGRECFEVLWEEFYGLKSSIVPAELVKSACPEKVMEFEEREPVEKKQKNRKPRAQKSKKETALAEIEKQLQHLLLDIEAGSNSFQDASFSSSMATSKIRTDATKSGKTRYMLLDTESESDKDNQDEAIICHSNGQSGTATVIDLLSPSPAMPVRKVSKWQQGNNGLPIDVIDLSD